MLKGGADADQQLAALGGERDGAVAAREELGVEEGLELADALRNGGLGDGQLVRGAGEAAEAGGGLERFHQVERGKVRFWHKCGLVKYMRKERLS